MDNLKKQLALFVENSNNGAILEPKEIEGMGIYEIHAINKSEFIDFLQDVELNEAEKNAIKQLNEKFYVNVVISAGALFDKMNVINAYNELMTSAGGVLND